MAKEEKKDLFQSAEDYLSGKIGAEQFQKETKQDYTKTVKAIVNTQKKEGEN